ncbi:MAG: hypothetical protein KGL95_14140, partial [Patescibacteria group bacterium]|nr:hypothetical protein [Patescibacteria group bacterium]
EFCNYGCYTNPSGSDHCYSGSSATQSTYNQCGSITGACVNPQIPVDHLVQVTKNAQSTNGNWLCKDQGVSSSCPTPTPPPPTPTPLPYGYYNCNNSQGGCEGWWTVDNLLVDGNSEPPPGEVGGIETSVTMLDTNAGDGHLSYFIDLIDHGHGDPACNSTEKSEALEVGLENDGTQNGEFFYYFVCPPGGTPYAYRLSNWIPSSDYGQNAYFFITQTEVPGQWRLHYDDGHNISGDVLVPFTPSNFQPYAWRYGTILTGTHGAVTSTADFTNNAWCPWNGFATNCYNWQFYNGYSDYYQDQTNNYNLDYPLKADWYTYPYFSSTGGDFQTYISY